MVSEITVSGDQLRNAGDYNGAIKCYNEAIRKNPNNVEVHIAKGDSLYHLGQDSEDIECCGVTNTECKTQTQPNRHYSEALECFDAALKIDPNNTQAYKLKGDVMYRLGQYKDAVVHYGTALSIEPNDVNTHIFMGDAIYMLGRYEEALEYYDAALKIDPDNIQAHIFKGDSMYNLERYDEAIECCDAALSINPNNAEAHYLRGCSMDRLGRYAEAIECCDAALSINPNYSEARHVKDIATNSLSESQNCQHRRLIACREKPIVGSFYCGKHIKNHY